MQLFWKILLLFMLVHVKFAREVNNRFGERSSDSNELLFDLFEDENEINEDSLETEEDEKTDDDFLETEEDEETDDDFLETEDDEATDEKSDQPEAELPSDNPEERKPVGGRCTKEQLAYFPHRLRDWFYIIKQELSEKKDDDEEILLPLKESEDSDIDRTWVKAVLWKFCDLDNKPQDRYLSKEELVPLRDPLVSMEPCIDPFLADCDSNDDTQVTLQEWGRCLGLKYDEIKDDCKVL